MTIRHYSLRPQTYTAKFCGVFFGFSVTVLFLSIGFYLASTNAIAIQGNTSSQFEKKIQESAKQQQRLQVEMAELSSLYRLQNKEGEFQVVVPSEVLYVTPSGPLAFR